MSADLTFASRRRLLGPATASRGVAGVVAQIWPSYVAASVLILLGFHWGLPGSQFVPRSWQDDENAAVWAVQQISFPLFDPRWLPWGTALFYQVYVVKEIVTLGGLLRASDHEVLVLGRLVVFVSALGTVTAVFLLGRRWPRRV